MSKTTTKSETKAKKTTKAKPETQTTLHAAAEPKAKKTRKTKADKGEAVQKACRMTSCKREYKSKGYCKFHYKQWRQGKFGLARYKTCKDIGCRKPLGLNRHGFCEDHFQNYYVKGMEVSRIAAEPAATPKKEDAAAG